MSSDFPEAATKITYIEGRPAELTLKRIKLGITREGRFEEKTFDADTITVGAAADNSLQLDDETVSRYHCRIFLERDHFMIKDLDSTNGTFVNRVAYARRS
jgi:pSer/pThr/pTyr-binding forkhead associated (FHA) protein